MLASMANRGASSSSAPFTKSWKYHVFLCFRGEDTRHNFTDHLYSALCQQGINTFRDDDELRRGEETSSALLTAIEESKISVVVFSKNYASSKSCLDELVKILDCKESNQQLVMPVFYKVNPSDIRNHRGSFGDALANMDCNNVEKINRWKEALSQAGKLAGFTLSDEHRSEAELIHKIVQRISREVIDRTYLYVTEYPVGMHHLVKDITKLLDFGEKDVRMVGIWGIGGIGKTTIAKAVYNSIVHEFEGSCFLENVRERAMWQRGGLAKLQENLLSDILRGNFFEVPNVHIGATMIRERMSGRKILLVLDDVDDMEQLHKLVGACDWFGAGSRIIITTRDKQLLTAHDVNLIHEVKILDYYKALELFCWHAFKRSGPPLGDYVKLAERALRYAQGLPLALKVLGSCLYGGSIDIWEAALHGFKSPKIQDVLKISYNALDHSVQQVFLDIACFFKGKSRMRLTKIVVACDPRARYSIEVLMEKALISVEGDYIWMHDLLEEMGKDIVQQESPDEPGGRSRLWSHEDIEHVLTNDTGTEKITGIMLNSPEMDYEIFLDVDCFLKMKNLKIFMNYNVCLSGNIGYLPNMLRVLDWHRCPLQSFPPNFRPKGLVVLNLPCSHIKQLREGLKPAVNTGHFINVLLPGSEVPESFSFRKDVGVLLPNNNDHLLDFPIEIPWTSLLENMVLCTVCEPTESFIRPCFPGLSLSNLIDGVWGFPGDDYSVSEGLTGAGHVELRYIPLPAHTKRKRALHRIIHVSYRGGRGLFKSFGADLSRNSMPKDGFGFCSMPEDGDDDENEDEDELDDVGDEVRPRKRKKTTSLCISMHQSDPKFIQNIIEEISKYVLNRVPLEVAEHPVGMQPQIQVMNKLLDLRENDVRMIGVWGTGGIGMTTIAKAVYNSIAHKFEGCSFLAKVRERSTSHEVQSDYKRIFFLTF